MAARFKLLCFDLDDTLWPCGPTIAAAEQTLYEWMQREVPQITAQHDITSLREKRMAFLAAHPELGHDLSQMRRASMCELADEFGLAANWVEPGFEIYHRARQQVKLYEDVAPALDQLAQQYRLAAVTNGNADLELTGVGHWFEFAISSAQVGKPKPDEDFFAHLLQRAQVSVSEAIVIGDDIERDIVGASQLGIRTVWVNRAAQVWPEKYSRPDAEVMDFHNLADVLTRLEAAS